MFKTLAFAGLTTALLFSAMPAHAGVKINGIPIQCFQTECTTVAAVTLTDGRLAQTEGRMAVRISGIEAIVTR